MLNVVLLHIFFLAATCIGVLQAYSAEPQGVLSLQTQTHASNSHFTINGLLKLTKSQRHVLFLEMQQELQANSLYSATEISRPSSRFEYNGNTYLLGLDYRYKFEQSILGFAVSQHSSYVQESILSHFVHIKDANNQALYVKQQLTLSLALMCKHIDFTSNIYIPRKHNEFSIRLDAKKLGSAEEDAELPVLIRAMYGVDFSMQINYQILDTVFKNRLEIFQYADAKEVLYGIKLAGQISPFNDLIFFNASVEYDSRDKIPLVALSLAIKVTLPLQITKDILAYKLHNKMTRRTNIYNSMQVIVPEA